MTTREELEELDRQEAAADPTDVWPPEDQDRGLTRAYWLDPERSYQGQLSADRIRNYQYAVGRMIRPFQEVNLHPASYDLTLGPRCFVRGKERILSERDPVLTIPPNSIAFITSRERLLIPHWLIARFNLATRWLFYGLLMGVGPQVDPGFQGVLSAPLHNVASDPVQIRLGEPVVRMDFTKTGLCGLTHVTTEAELYEHPQYRSVGSGSRELLKFWDRHKRWRQPIYFAPQARSTQSSLEALEERTARNERRLTIGGIASVALAATLLGATAAIGAAAFNYADGRVTDNTSALQRELDLVGQEARRSQAALGHRTHELRALERRVRQLERR